MTWLCSRSPRLFLASGSIQEYQVLATGVLIPAVQVCLMAQVQYRMNQLQDQATWTPEKDTGVMGPCVMTLIPRKEKRVLRGARNPSDLRCPSFPYLSVLSHHGSCNATCGSWEASPSAQTWHRAPALGSGYYQAAPTRSQAVRAMPFEEKSIGY